MNYQEICRKYSLEFLISADLRGADLRGANLSDADLSGANLRCADLIGANLSDADLGYADLSDANLRGANLRGADLRYADLSDANLIGANLRGADLIGANLRGADLRYADLSDANLSDANLSDADLRYADLSDANLSDADLSGANLRCADLSQSKGLPKASRVLDLLEKTNEGLIVYKTFGSFRTPPEEWVGQEVIEEVANLLPTDECGCGINVATFDWVVQNTNGQIWQCLLKWEDLAESVVPYSSDGKFRCSRLTKIKPVDRP